MRYMYTTTPDKHCHEVESGVYGRPVHSYEESALQKQGWSLNITNLRGTSDVRQEKEGQEEGEISNENMDYDEYLRQKYEEVVGKKPHYKLKRETLEEKIAEAETNGQ